MLYLVGIQCQNSQNLRERVISIVILSGNSRNFRFLPLFQKFPEPVFTGYQDLSNAGCPLCDDRDRVRIGHCNGEMIRPTSVSSSRYQRQLKFSCLGNNQLPILENWHIFLHQERIDKSATWSWSRITHQTRII